jgi:hypothetical protein
MFYQNTLLPENYAPLEELIALFIYSLVYISCPLGYVLSDHLVLRLNIMLMLDTASYSV